MSTKADVTIVVSPREQFAMAEQSLESIYEHTDIPFELVYIDGNSPPPVEEYLRGASEERGFKLRVHFDGPIGQSREHAPAVGHEAVRTAPNFLQAIIDGQLSDHLGDFLVDCFGELESIQYQ